MLYEIRHLRQIPGEAPRRLFMDNCFDLIVWFGASQAIMGFQLVYDKAGAPRALTWHQDGKYSHNRVEDGESRPGKGKASPILLPDGPFDPRGVGEAFAHASTHIDSTVAQFVWQKLVAYAGGPHQSS